MSQPRWATDSDNEGLIALTRDCPMEGSLRLYFDRAPDYFALSRLQGTGARVMAVDGSTPGTLAAAAAISHQEAVFVDGEPRGAFYTSDLRVREGYRGGRLLKRLFDFATPWAIEQGWDLGTTTVMAGNGAMAPVLAGKAGLPPYLPLATLANFTVQFLLPKRQLRGVAVRRATEADVGAMVELWNRLNGPKQFAPVWSEAGFRSRLSASPGLAIGDYALAFVGDRLVGLAAMWDQAAFKRMVVLGYAPSMQRMRGWYNPLAAVMGLSPIPEVGASLRYFYVTQIAAESASVLEALYVHAYNAGRKSGYLFFSTMLDERDPLMAALSGFMTQRVDIAMYVVDPARKWGDRDWSGRVAYFDPSLV